jgi:carbonic anhydrase
MMGADRRICSCQASIERHDRAAPESLSRRRLLGGGIAGMAAAAVPGLGAALFDPRAARAQEALTPDTALTKLIDGNQRFVDDQLISPSHDLARIREHTAEKQKPFAAVLSCADSRVPIEWVFDQTIGRLFVARVAGNIATPEVIASLEYGAVVLHTKVIMVLGHGNCGAVQAAIAVKAAPGQISSLYAYIRPAVDQAGPDLEATIKANAENQAVLLREASPALAKLISEGELQIVAAFYDLVSGRVTLLD